MTLAYNPQLLLPAPTESNALRLLCVEVVCSSMSPEHLMSWINHRTEALNRSCPRSVRHISPFSFLNDEGDDE